MSKKHQKLTQYLKEKLDLLNLNKENFESSMEKMVVENSGVYFSDNSQVLCKTKTDCVYWFENINGKYLPLLTALISAWLYYNDFCNNSDDNAQISMDITELEDISKEKYMDLEITLTFVDEITLQENESGPIELDGIKYDEGTAEIYVAEAGTVNGA